MEAEVEQRGDRPLLVMHDGGTKSISGSFDARWVATEWCFGVRLSPPFCHYSER